MGFLKIKISFILIGFLFSGINSDSPKILAANNEAIVISTMQVPGYPNGTVFNSFNNPIAFDSGAIKFYTYFNGTAWIYQNGTYTQVVAPGTQMPGVQAGVVFQTNSFTYQKVNEGSRITYDGTVAGTGVTNANDQGAWLWTPSNHQLIFRENDPAPGLAGDSRISTISANSNIDTNNKLFVSTKLTGANVSTSNDSALWFGSPGSFSLVARESAQAAGLPVGITYGDTLFQLVEDYRTKLINPTEHYFYGSVAGPGISTSNDSVIWKYDGGSAQPVFQEGVSAPGITGVTITAPAQQQAHGQKFAFVSTLVGTGVTTANDRAAWLGNTAGDLSLIAREGTQAPGWQTGANFNGTFNLSLMDSSQYYLQAYVNGTTGSGLWKGVANNLDLILKSEDLAPGFSDGTLIGRIDPPQVNSAGQMLFSVSLLKANQQSLGGALYGGTPDNLELIMFLPNFPLPGTTLVDIDPASGVSLVSFGGFTGEGTSWHLGEDGTVVYQGSAGGVEGVFTYKLAAIPEPSTIALSLIIGVGLAWRIKQHNKTVS